MKQMPEKHAIKPGQSIELLKELHILTRDGKLNQDSRRKLKQVNHLYQFIEPLLQEVQQDHTGITLVDHGAGKSYLGFILYDLFFKNHDASSHIFGIETRDELVEKSRALAERLQFSGMSFLNLSVADSINSGAIPETVDVVTALHACNTATDDAILFALKKKARFIVLVPCCQAEVAAVLRKNKAAASHIEQPDRGMASPAAYARIRQSRHQCPALPAAGGARLSGQRHRIGRVGTFHEKRADYRQLQRSAAPPTIGAPE